MADGILEMRFAEVARQRPFGLLSGVGPRATGSDFAVDPQPSAPAGTDVVFVATGPAAAWATGCAPAPADAPLALGLLAGDGGLWALFDPAAGELRLLTVDATGATTVNARTPWRPSGGNVAAAVTGPSLVALVDTSGTWQPVAAVELGTDHMADDRPLRWAYATGGEPRADVVAGMFQAAGVRDPHVVQDADGAPVIRNGRVLLTMTNAGLGHFRSAHWALWTLELEPPYRLTEVAKLFGRRGGFVLGDHAGQVVRDDDRWIVLVSSWGDFAFDGVHVRHMTTGADLLGGVHVLDTSPYPLPTEHSAWDPALTRIDGAWHVAFAESLQQQPRFIFRPALARTATGARYDAPLTLVGRDATREHTEGPIIQRVGDDWHVLASDGADRCYRVYDLAMRERGHIDAPYVSNTPHAMVLPHATGAGSPHLMVTFDGTPYAEDVLGYGTHGDLVVMAAPALSG